MQRNSVPRTILVIILAFSTLSFVSKVQAEDSEEIVIDTVVASINGKPITLVDVGRRLEPPHPITMAQLSHDPSARQILEGMILERLVEEEAENRKIKVSDAEVSGYIEEVARKNRMSRDQFIAALRSENRDVDIYKQQVRADILRSRLIGQLMQSGVAISEKEIEEYIKEHPSIAKSGQKLKLRQIVISSQNRSPEEVEARIAGVKERIEKGDSFADIAAAISDGRESQDGGLLGVVNEADLTRQIFDAILSLKEGTASEPISTPDGTRFFFVEKRFEEEGAHSDQLAQEVKKQLEERKMQEKMQTFFTQDLMKLHAVDRKI